MVPDNLQDLNARFTLCRLCISVLSEVDQTDPRWADALAEYNRQLLSISNRIAAITGKPPDITIGLKPARLFPEAGGLQ
ncbi:MAG: hypothetical protein IT318_23745 [Anaerolineales bacterium]|nr:hypothetical protein [Anaerolineales bacterium]